MSCSMCCKVVMKKLLQDEYVKRTQLCGLRKVKQRKTLFECALARGGMVEVDPYMWCAGCSCQVCSAGVLVAVFPRSRIQSAKLQALGACYWPCARLGV